MRTAENWQLSEGDTVETVQYQTVPASEPADDEAKHLADRAETLRAAEEFVARDDAEMVATAEEVFALARGERSGNLDDAKRRFREAVDARKAQGNRYNRFLDRFAREDAGEIERPATAVRKTEPAHRVLAHELAHPLVSTFGVNEPWTPDDERLELLAPVARVGTDLPPEERRAEVFERLRLAEGLIVFDDVVLVGERRDSRVVRLVLRGRRLPAIVAPEGDDARAEELDRLARDVEAEKLKQAPPPWPSCEWQGQARQAAWAAMLTDERAHPSNRGKPAWQVERELARRLPAWANAVGVEVPQ